MKIKSFLKMGLLVMILSFSASAAYSNVGSGKTQHVVNKLNADYSVTYDSFVLGALPVWIDRTYDEGSKLVTLRIDIEGHGTTYRDVEFYDGVQVQRTFNEIAGPYFVEVSIYSVVDL